MQFFQISGFSKFDESNKEKIELERIRFVIAWGIVYTRPEKIKAMEEAQSKAKTAFEKQQLLFWKPFFALLESQEDKH